PPRGEADGVRLFAEAPTDAIDPAEAQGLIDGLGPRDARAPGALLVEADQKLPGGAVVRLKPRAEISRGGKERGLTRSGSRWAGRGPLLRRRRRRPALTVALSGR